VLPSGEQFEIACGDLHAVVVEVGGGIRSLTHGGDDVLLGYGEREMCTAGRGQVLAPWPNRLEDGSYRFDGRDLQLPLSEPPTRTAIHGLVRWSSWQCVDRARDAVTMAHVLHPQAGYPFTLRMEVEYRVDERGLAVETRAENLGDEALPFGLAHHPYLAGAPLADELDVALDAATRVVADERKLPAGRDENDLRSFRVGSRELDTTFTDFATPRVRVGDRVVWFDEAFRYVQLFTGDHPAVERRGLAVEPMTCPANAFRTGEDVVRLEPGERFRGRWGIET
jgi:aldose 1-epimerase